MQNNSILIVDDEITILKTLSRILGKLNMTIFTAQDETEALNIWNQQNINLLIIDVFLKNSTGNNLVSKCNVLKPIKNTKIIYMSGSKEQALKEIDKKDQIKYNLFLAKPFNSQEIINAIQNENL